MHCMPDLLLEILSIDAISMPPRNWGAASAACKNKPRGELLLIPTSHPPSGPS